MTSVSSKNDIIKHSAITNIIKNNEIIPYLSSKVKYGNGGTQELITNLNATIVNNNVIKLFNLFTYFITIISYI